MTQAEYSKMVADVTNVNAPYDRVHQMSTLKKFFTVLGEKLFEVGQKGDKGDRGEPGQKGDKGDAGTINRTAHLATVNMIKVMIAEGHSSEPVAAMFIDYCGKINDAIAQ
jgi:hypothetical protein